MVIRLTGVSEGVKRRLQHGTKELRRRTNYREGERFAKLVGAPDNRIAILCGQVLTPRGFI